MLLLILVKITPLFWMMSFNIDCKKMHCTHSRCFYSIELIITLLLCIYKIIFVYIRIFFGIFAYKLFVYT